MLPVYLRSYRVYLKSECLSHLGFEALILFKVVAEGSKQSEGTLRCNHQLRGKIPNDSFRNVVISCK